MGKGERVQYLPTHLLEKAAPLIRLAYLALRELKENRPDDASVKTIVEIPLQLHTQLHRMKMDAGYKNFSQYVLSILIEHASKRI